jgi:hypothetical protein
MRLHPRLPQLRRKSVLGHRGPAVIGGIPAVLHASPQGASPIVPPVSPTVGVPQQREARIGASGRGSPAPTSKRAPRSSPSLLPSCMRQRDILPHKKNEFSAGSARATFAPGTPLRRALPCAAGALFRSRASDAEGSGRIPGTILI